MKTYLILDWKHSILQRCQFPQKIIYNRNNITQILMRSQQNNAKVHLKKLI